MEIIYKNDTEEEVIENIEMPKNFRQIGSPVGKSKLYIEDYVSTYLKQLQKDAAYGTDSAVLLGKIKNTEQGVCVFVSAAVPIEKTEKEEKKTTEASTNTCFGEEEFTKIYQVMKEYFTDIQVVGWVQMISSLQMQITPKIAKTHRQFFPGRGKVFWMLNLIDKEEKVYLYQKGELNDLHGYYIYYEKNTQMQEYMVQQKEKNQKALPEENIDDMVTKNYRERMTQAKPSSEKRGLQLALYAASAGVMATVCILGVSMLNNYESMKQMQNAIAVISNSITEPETKEQEAVHTQASVSTQESKEPEKDKEIAQKDTSKETSEVKAEEGTIAGETKEGNSVQDAVSTGKPDVAETEKPDAADTEKTDTANAEETEAEKGEDEVDNAANEEPTTDTAGTQDTGKAAAPDKSNEAAQDSSPAIASQNEEVQVWLDQGYYIVQAGENLETICRKIYKTTAMLDKLCEANNIENVDIIYAGQKLILP